MISCKTRTIVLVIPKESPTKPYHQFHVRPKKKTSIEAHLSLRNPMANIGRSPSSSSLILTSGASGRVNALFSVRVLRSVVMVMKALIVVVLVLVPFRGRRREEKQQEGSSRKGSSALRRSRRKSSVVYATGVVEQEIASRRELAINGVVNDNENHKSLREYSLFHTPRGEIIFTQSWTPLSLNNRGLVLLLHGLNEHSGRYDNFAKQLNANGYKVYGMDWIGHGGSDGLHAYVHSLDYAVTDMKLFLEKVLADNPGLPCFCFGHSTGGAIILKALLDPKVEARVAGAVMTSPAVGVEASHPILAVLAPVFAFLLPRYQFSAANKKGMPVSRDPEALVAKYSDPLVYTGSIRVRTGYEILRIASYLQQNLSKLRVPFLVLHGTADTVTNPEASQKFYEEASSIDKTIKLFDGFVHDLLFEPEREAIMKDIIEWFNCRV